MKKEKENKIEQLNNPLRMGDITGFDDAEIADELSDKPDQGKGVEG